MSPLIVLQKIRQTGGSVSVRDQELRIQAPAGLLTPEDHELLAKHKADLMRLLAPSYEEIERSAIQWESSAPAEELDQALDQARREWELIADPFGDWVEQVDTDGSLSWVNPAYPDQPTWDELEPIPDPCQQCGEIKFWWDSYGTAHCERCDPPRDLPTYNHTIYRNRHRYLIGPNAVSQRE